MTWITTLCMISAISIVFSSAYQIHIQNNCKVDADIGTACSGTLAAGASTDCQLSSTGQISILNGGSASQAEFFFAPMTPFQYYDVSFKNGFNVGVQIVPGDTSCHVVDCPDADCSEAIRQNADYLKYRFQCSASQGFTVTFCP